MPLATRQSGQRSMDHADAVALCLAKHYVLGELQEEDAEAFEAHMFGCALCAEQVRLGFEFLEGAGDRVWRQTAQTIEGDTKSRRCRTFPKRQKRTKYGG